jgi:hypothetical protein
MSKKFGIDVSKWQGNFDFSKAKSKDKVEFVILRGAYSTTKDIRFDNYYAKCKSLNLPVGVYHYSIATTVEQARAEAEFLYTKVLKGKQFELPIYIDVEDAKQLALSKEALTKIVQAWCDYLEGKGYFVGIYASLWTFQSELNDKALEKYTHWIAQWSKECTYTGDIDMWQFGGERNALRSNQIAGQTVDQDYMYRDFPSIIKAAGLNGFGKSTVKPKPQTNFTRYKVRVKVAQLNYREGAGVMYRIKGQIKKNEIYSIVEEKNGWGRLLSGAGWINLKYVEKI